MKIQYLSIVFIIIALPIIIVTSVYNRLQIKTIQMQKDYDDKLITATYDAMRAFQINTENNEYSTATDSGRRDVEAAVETFVTSLSTGLGVGGYGTSYLKPYIPAMLFTSYNGYYIYAPTYNSNPDKLKIEYMVKPFITYSQRYVNSNIDIVIDYTLDNYITIHGKVGSEYVRKSGYLNYYLLNNDLNEEKEVLSERLLVTKESFTNIQTVECECWQDNNYLYIIKYTVPYSGAEMYYVPEITYTDESFPKSDMKRQWLNVVGNEAYYYYYDNEANYTRYYYNENNNRWFAFNTQEIVRISNNTVPTGAKLRNVKFELSNVDYSFDTARINENDYVEGFIKEYKYRYEKNAMNKSVKVYYDEERKQEFTYLDTTKRYRPVQNVEYAKDSSYYNYATEAQTGSKEFTQWVIDNLGNLRISDAKGEGNTNIMMFENDTAKFLNISEDNKPEEANSLFNTHKREVIKLSIEKNLLAAINNYDKISVALDTTYHFKMPVIPENEWDKIISNVSLVTFLQGLPVGFKTYNNYSIITSSTNKEYLTDDSIYFLDDSHSTYHLINCQELKITDNVVGYRNSDYERSKATIKLNGQKEQTVYYYKQNALPCYYCIVNRLASRARNIFDSNSDDYNWVDANGKTAEERRQQYYKALGRERYNVVMW